MGEQRESQDKGAADQVLLERIEMISSQNQSSDMSGIFSKGDYIQTIVITIVCLCIVVAGGFLGT